MAALLVVSPAIAAPLTLAEALRLAVEQSPEAGAAQAAIPIARADVSTARMFPNPTLGIGGARAEPVFTAGIQLHLPVFGQLGAHVDAARLGVTQVEAETSLATWRLRHEARVDYFTVARTVEEVAIAIEIERITGRVADMARQRFEAGAGSALERDQAALLHVRAQQDIFDRRAAERIARLELGRVIGRSSEAIEPLADPLGAPTSTPPIDALLDGARRSHPELRALSAERAAALSRAIAARADRRPVPTVEVGVDVLEASTCGGTSRCLGPRGALSFDVPLFNLNRGPIERAEAEAKWAEARRAAALQRVETTVRAAFESMAAASLRARFFDGEYLPAAVRVEAMAQEGFTAGKTGLLPLLESERALDDARLGRAQALFDVQVARADLETASGVPLDAP